MRESGGDSHNLLQYTFPNLRAHINFSVTAVNIVGDGESNSMVYEACEHPDRGKCLSPALCSLLLMPLTPVTAGRNELTTS